MMASRTRIGIISMLVLFAFIATGALIGTKYNTDHGGSATKVMALAPAKPSHEMHISTQLRVTSRTTPQGFGVAVIHGCIAEDTCRADYHANGTWTIRPWLADH